MISLRKTLENGNVYLFKLNSAEELVAVLASQDNFANGVYILSKPRVVAQQIVQDKNGKQQIAISLVPWFTGNQLTDDCPLEKNMVISIIPASNEMAAMYLENTTSIALR